MANENFGGPPWSRPRATSTGYPGKAAIIARTPTEGLFAEQPEQSPEEKNVEDLLALPYVGALPSEKEKKGIVVNKPEAFQGYTLYTIGGQCRSDLIDLNGRVVKSWSAEPCIGNWHNAELLAGGDLLVVNPSSGVVL